MRAAYAPADEAALSRLGVTERADTVLVLREGADAAALEAAFEGLYAEAAGLAGMSGDAARQAAIAAAAAEYRALGMDMDGMRSRAIWKYGGLVLLLALAGAAAEAGVGSLGRRAAWQPQTRAVDGLDYTESLLAVAIGGGRAGNSVPDEARLVVNFRFAPSKEGPDATWDQINQEMAREVPGTGFAQGYTT